MALYSFQRVLDQEIHHWLRVCEAVGVVIGAGLKDDCHLPRTARDMAGVRAWGEVSGGERGAGNRMLVVQHPANEYPVWYPEGEKAIYFRAFAGDLPGHRCSQNQ